MGLSRGAKLERSALRSLKIFAEIGTAVLIIFVLFAARDVLIPITLSVLLSFLLTPVVNWFQKKGLNNITAVMVTASGLFVLLAVGLVLLGSSIAEFANDYPKYKGEITRKVETIQGVAKSWGDRFDSFVASSINKDGEAGTEKGGGKAESIEETAGSSGREQDRNAESNEQASPPRIPTTPSEVRTAGGSFNLQSYLGSLGSIFGPIGTAGLVVVFALFMLIYRDDLRDRFVAVISRGNYVVTTEAIAEASERISKYISAQFLLNSAYGIVFGIGLWLIGLFISPTGDFPNIFFFAVMAGVVRFLPYVGPLIGAGLPLLISVAVFPGYSVFIAVLIMIVAMELISNNIVEPWLYGSRTGVSAIGVITAAVFWGWLWGGVGLLLATPLTVCLVVLGRYVPKMKYFATLLSDEEQVPPSLRSYQRLLANDEHKLKEALLDQIKKKEPLEFIDEVIVPLAKRILKQPVNERPTSQELTERLREVLENEHIKEELFPDLEDVETTDTDKVAEDDGQSEVAADTPDKQVNDSLLITAIGSRASIEDVLLKLFVQMNPKFRWHLVDAGDMPDSSTREIIEMNPDAVLILSLPPGGVRQTQFWCKNLRKGGYDRDIIVARPAKMQRYHDLFVLLRKAGATSLTTSFTQTARRLQGVRPRLPRVAFNATTSE